MSTNRNRRPTHPGAVLREDVLPGLGVTQRGFAERLGVSRQTLNGVLCERTPVSTDLAHRLGRLWGTSPDVWVGMQRDVDLWDALQENRETYERIRPLGAAVAHGPGG